MSEIDKLNKKAGGGGFSALIASTAYNRADEPGRSLGKLVQAVIYYRGQHPADCRCPGCFLVDEVLQAIK